MKYLEDIDYRATGFGAFFDELPLWSAPFGQLLLEHVPLRNAITILDIGAGTGFLSMELAQRCGSSSSVIAVDPWAEGLKRLRDKLRHRGIANIQIIESGAEKLDLDDESVDLVVSNLGINNFEDPDAVLAECFRLAKPGATLALTTNLVGHMRELYEVLGATLRELDMSDQLPALQAHVQHRGTIETVSKLVERAGFAIEQSVNRSFKMRFADGSSLLRHYLIRLGFLPDWKKLVPAHLVERTFESFEAGLNARTQRDGVLSLSIPMAYLQAVKPLVAANTE